ncbi:MAG: hypothetical protein RDV41_10885 [Planctomycetota bacterium]|nr:hypothetical protein [Planctomycetota bacterium]
MTAHDGSHSSAARLLALALIVIAAVGVGLWFGRFMAEENKGDAKAAGKPPQVARERGDAGFSSLEMRIAALESRVANWEPDPQARVEETHPAAEGTQQARSEDARLAELESLVNELRARLEELTERVSWCAVRPLTDSELANLSDTELLRVAETAVNNSDTRGAGREYYELFMRRFPAHERLPEALFALCSLYLRWSPPDVDKAIQAGEMFLAQYPDHEDGTSVCATLGDAYRAKGDPARAVLMYDHALQRASEGFYNAELLYNKAMAQYEAADKDGAYETLRGLIRKHDADADEYVAKWVSSAREFLQEQTGGH